MATKKEKQELMEVLKFTPRTYKIRLWGYGGEYVMGTVDRKIYDYFRQRRLDLSEYAWDGDYADEHNIPEDMQPFYPGQWHDGDDMGHCWGVDRSAGTLQVEDEHGNIVYEKSLEDISGWGVDEENPENSDPEWTCDEEIWIDMKPAGTVVFMGVSSEKGTFFEGELPLTMPFNPGKISLCYNEIDGNEIISSITYDGEDVENWGGDTTGKGSDFGFYVAGSNKQDGKGYEKYRNMDDIEYGMTEWFPKKVKPIREGIYNIKTAGRNSYTHQAKWTGTRWISSWQEDGSGTEEIKIKEWQGIAYDPDEHFLREELDKIAAEWPGFPTAGELDELEQMYCTECHWIGNSKETINNEHDNMVCPKCGSAVEFANGDSEADALVFDLETMNDDMNPWKNTNTEPTTPKQSKWWTVRTYYKKSCEQHEYFTHPDYKGSIKVIDGFRSCTYNVETNDGEFPQFEFTTVPGGNANKDSLDMNSLYGNNIESSELVEMFDGGCWGDIEYPEDMSEEDQEELAEFIEENGTWALEDDRGWTLDETEVWVWGPLEVTDDAGNTRIVIADADGNMTDFRDE